jgi:hypothetical protein
MQLGGWEGLPIVVANCCCQLLLQVVVVWPQRCNKFPLPRRCAASLYAECRALIVRIAETTTDDCSDLFGAVILNRHPRTRRNFVATSTKHASVVRSLVQGTDIQLPDKGVVWERLPCSANGLSQSSSSSGRRYLPTRLAHDRAEYFLDCSCPHLIPGS